MSSVARQVGFAQNWYLITHGYNASLRVRHGLSIGLDRQGQFSLNPETHALEFHLEASGSIRVRCASPEYEFVHADGARANTAILAPDIPVFVWMRDTRLMLNTSLSYSNRNEPVKLRVVPSHARALFAASASPHKTRTPARRVAAELPLLPDIGTEPPGAVVLPVPLQEVRTEPVEAVAAGSVLEGEIQADREAEYENDGPGKSLVSTAIAETVPVPAPTMRLSGRSGRYAFAGLAGLVIAVLLWVMSGSDRQDPAARVATTLAPDPSEKETLIEKTPAVKDTEIARDVDTTTPPVPNPEGIIDEVKADAEVVGEVGFSMNPLIADRYDSIVDGKGVEGITLFELTEDELSAIAATQPAEVTFDTTSEIMGAAEVTLDEKDPAPASPVPEEPTVAPIVTEPARAEIAQREIAQREIAQRVEKSEKVQEAVAPVSVQPQRDRWRPVIEERAQPDPIPKPAPVVSADQPVPIVENSTPLSPTKPAAVPEITTPPELPRVALSELTLVKKREPRYPRIRGDEAVSVDLEFVVGRNGEVRNVQVKGDVPGRFEKSAVRAVQRWRFEPVRNNGVSEPVISSVRVTFQP